MQPNKARIISYQIHGSLSSLAASSSHFPIRNLCFNFHDLLIGKAVVEEFDELLPHLSNLRRKRIRTEFWWIVCLVLWPRQDIREILCDPIPITNWVITPSVATRETKCQISTIPLYSRNPRRTFRVIFATLF